MDLIAVLLGLILIAILYLATVMMRSAAQIKDLLSSPKEPIAWMDEGAIGHRVSEMAADLRTIKRRAYYLRQMRAELHLLAVRFAVQEEVDILEHQPPLESLVGLQAVERESPLSDEDRAEMARLEEIVAKVRRDADEDEYDSALWRRDTRIRDEQRARDSAKK